MRKHAPFLALFLALLSLCIALGLLVGLSLRSPQPHGGIGTSATATAQP